MNIIVYWYLAMLAEGVACLPLAYHIFRRFTDRGWMFAKTTGLFLSAWLLWVLNCTGTAPFTHGKTRLVILIMAAVNYGAAAAAAMIRLIKGLAAANMAAKTDARTACASAHAAAVCSPARTAGLIALEEALFFLIFAASVYIIGFRPEAYGTEKFMDYSFITSMMRSLYMPFEDPWYAGYPVNYYYGGQYAASFLTKLTGVTAGEGYNLMRGLVTSLSFVLPFSLIFQLLSDRREAYGTAAAGRRKTRPAYNTAFEAAYSEKSGRGLPGILFGALPLFGGVLAGIGTAFSGNLHYVLYGLIGPAVDKLMGRSSFYWFPDSTRYIGYNPDLPDKTIHEFPAYASVLGDLHAHYINMIFVITVTAIVYGWAQKQEAGAAARKPYASFEALLIGLMTGVFRWTNFWDFPIYFVVCGSVFFFVTLSIRGRNLKGFPRDIIILALEMFLVGYAGALPFTASFDQISTQVGLTHSHTLLHQLAVLWGAPFVCLVIFIVVLLKEKLSGAVSGGTTGRAVSGRKDRKKASRMALPDLAALLFGLCASGLVFLPEVIYVKDIYGDEHYRANTMFKLTFQAFILFAMCTAYICVRLIMTGIIGKCSLPADGLLAGQAVKNQPVFEAEAGVGKKSASGSRRLIAAGICMAAVIVITGGFTVTAVRQWFGDVSDPALRISTDASVFISESFPEDFDAVCWLNENVHGQPVILEGTGESYSDACRISVATGLPTVAGWDVHEWLWRNDADAVYERFVDCENIYTAADAGTAEALLDKYGVKYIYIGKYERESYQGLNEELLRSLGEVVFEDENGTLIIER